MMDQIHEHQFKDQKLCLIWDKVAKNEPKEVVLDIKYVLRIES